MNSQKKKKIDFRSQIRKLNDRRKNENFKFRILKNDIHRVENATKYKTIMKKNLCNYILKQMLNNQTMLFESFFDT